MNLLNALLPLLRVFIKARINVICMETKECGVIIFVRLFLLCVLL